MFMVRDQGFTLSFIYNSRIKIRRRNNSQQLRNTAKLRAIFSSQGYFMFNPHKSVDDEFNVFSQLLIEMQLYRKYHFG